MKELKTLFCIGGMSASGKSTRVHLLIKFLEKAGYKPTGSLVYRNTCVGREYFNSFYVIGKEIWRSGTLCWQGMDSYSKTFTEPSGIRGGFEFFWKVLESKHLILDSHGLLLSNLSRPLAMETAGVEAKSYSHFFYFENLEDYTERVKLRTNGKGKLRFDAERHNNLYPAHKNLFMKELPQLKHPERHEFVLRDANELVWVLGVAILERVGLSDKVEAFKQFAQDYWANQKPVKIIDTAEELF